jgi:hypothetical protein
LVSLSLSTFFYLYSLEGLMVTKTMAKTGAIKNKRTKAVRNGDVYTTATRSQSPKRSTRYPRGGGDETVSNPYSTIYTTDQRSLTSQSKNGMKLVFGVGGSTDCQFAISTTKWLRSVQPMNVFVAGVAAHPRRYYSLARLKCDSLFFLE